MVQEKFWILKASINESGRLQIADQGNFGQDTMVYALEVAKKAVLDGAMKKGVFDVKELERQLRSIWMDVAQAKSIRERMLQDATTLRDLLVQYGLTKDQANMMIVDLINRCLMAGL